MSLSSGRAALGHFTRPSEPSTKGKGHAMRLRKQDEIMGYRHVVGIVIYLISLISCSLDDGGGDRPLTPPPSPPFQGTPTTTTTPSPSPTPPPSGTTCAATDPDRCNGNTWQVCDPSTHLWKNFALCDGIGGEVFYSAQGL